MSYADDMGFYTWSGEDFDEIEEAERKEWMEILKGYEHINVRGIRIDVREIDENYAFNLYNWYLRTVEIYITKEEFEDTVMGQALIKKLGGR